MVAARGTADNGITGSWHNSGYYGHFRSQVRNDFMNEYRQRAKPSPPQQFVQRSVAPVRKHVFSKHDSRERYKDNALYFVDGNGRKQVHSASFNYKPEFIAWMPHRKELIENRQPLTSVYRTNFHSGARGFASDPYTQRYSDKIARQATKISQSFDLNDEKASFSDGYRVNPAETFTTCYRKVHGTEDPRKEEAKFINTITTRSANSQRIERIRSARATRRETVASCLSWARPQTTVPESYEVTACHKIGNGGLESNSDTSQRSQPMPTLPHVANKEPVLIC